MGKYDSVVRDLPKLPAEVRYSGTGGAVYQQKVNDAKAEFLKNNGGDVSASSLLPAYASLRSVQDDLEAQLKEHGITVEAVAQLLMEAYDNEGITSLSIGNVGSVRQEQKPYSHVVDKVAFHQWCMENGFESQMQLPWQTTNSIVNEMLLENKQPPPGVEVYNKPTPVLTRVK